MSFTKQILALSEEAIGWRPDNELVVDSGWETESLGNVIWAAIWGGWPYISGIRQVIGGQ